ncbi:DUF6261 family protein [Flavobacterium sp. PLA-1-15]|uniref:DUF6261 family protein n=1 Tax=Flavobacterium sp. PLA-1-15 TaxID=3380533 RepID=UPI003B80DF92
MKLYPISTSQLQLLESGQFINRVITDFINTGIDPKKDGEFESIFSELQGQSPVYNDALMQVKAKAETETILKLDVIRDQKISTVRRAVSVFEYTDDAAQRMAYQELRSILKKYSAIDKANYEAESLGVDKLVKELKEAKFDAMNLLGLEFHILNLEKANFNFKKMFDSRSSNVISTETFDTKSLRNSIFATYKDLAEYVLLMAKRKKTPFFIETLKAINYGREYYADILAKRAATGTAQ